MGKREQRYKNDDKAAGLSERRRKAMAKSRWRAVMRRRRGGDVAVKLMLATSTLTQAMLNAWNQLNYQKYLKDGACRAGVPHSARQKKHRGPTPVKAAKSRARHATNYGKRLQHSWRATRQQIAEAWAEAKRLTQQADELIRQSPHGGTLSDGTILEPTGMPLYMEIIDAAGDAVDAIEVESWPETGPVRRAVVGAPAPNRAQEAQEPPRWEGRQRHSWSGRSWSRASSSWSQSHWSSSAWAEDWRR